MTLTEYAHSILEENGCLDNAYAGMKPETAIEELKARYPEGLKYGFSYEDVGAEICRIGDAVPVPPKDCTSAVGYDWNDVLDFGHYGIYAGEDALYDHNLEALKKELASGKDFNTGWHGFKKEIESLKVSAFGSKITVEVAASCDEMPYDLVSDCDGGDDLTDDEIDEVYNLYCGNFEATTDTDASGELDRSATVMDILTLASELMDGCQNTLHETYEFVQGCVTECLNGRETENNKAEE